MSVSERMRGSRGAWSGRRLGPIWSRPFQRPVPVSASSPIALLALVVLLGWTVHADELSRLPACDSTQEQIDLPAESNNRVYEVCISPGLATLIVFFSTELKRETLTLEGADQFTMVEVGKRSISLLPSENVVPGERLKLTARFADGDAPASISFVLVVHPARATRQVEVLRQKRTLASYQQAEKEKDLQLQQCREETVRLRSECGGPRGLTGLLAAMRMDKNGVVAKTVTGGVSLHPASALGLRRAISYRASGLVAVEVVLEAPAGSLPWTAAGAELVGPGRRTLRVLPPWQSEPIDPSVTDGRVVIETEATEQETRGSFSLKLWNEDGTRSVIVSGVTFP
ncbi:DUF2381 family protein [Corallococcus interemptor]|uniref:DUF2381 family protein n=1 Tax=Corallococcus interemptor TaxID=2316720 RepID=A0A3A8Q472_9BACT|nr:DUF2381 family protein [Corallococcus interemptor]RKH59682.1 DUF2381 family protein [Corallococcus interemptor]